MIFEKKNKKGMLASISWRRQEKNLKEDLFHNERLRLFEDRAKN